MKFELTIESSDHYVPLLLEAVAGDVRRRGDIEEETGGVISGYDGKAVGKWSFVRKVDEVAR